ncbi:MAG: sigma-54 dependent transcriptional regulator [Cytophagales bacterium]|nr:sigma-54 dependent transcriptional regulator [Cytophagales bacterium]
MKENAKLLVLDDDEAVLASAKMFLKQKFTYVHTLSNPDQLNKVLSDIEFDLLLLDMNLTRGENDGSQGLQLIEQVIGAYPDVEVIPITAYGEINLAVEAMRRGARDFITKPWSNDKLLASVQMALKLKSSATQEKPLLSTGIEHQLIGESRAFKTMMGLIDKVAKTDANILLSGENGTGKSLVAQTIHSLSDRNEHAMVGVDLGSLSSSLFESELFGHVKGAFTDAHDARMGKFELAHKSTLFLDEIGNLDLPQQSKLLTALQNREITRVGANEAIPFNIRLITASNSDLKRMVEEKTFRQDLMYRINTIEIEVPALRDRIEDIPLLANHFLKSYRKKYQKPGIKLHSEVIKGLQEYDWPGNIRELQHAMERAIILSDQTNLTFADFNLTQDPEDEHTMNLDLKEMEKTLILKALEKNKGNITHAAKDLGIDRLALYRRLEKYGL